MSEDDRLFPFQQKIWRDIWDDQIDTVAISMPRGNGKSWLMARAIRELIDTESDRFEDNKDVVLLAASIRQAKTVFKYLRNWLEHTGKYSWMDAANRCGVKVKGRNVEVMVISSNAKGAFGLVNTSYVFADECGAWEIVGGKLMHSALVTAQGKMGSPLKAVFASTLAPGPTNGWWHQMIEGGNTIDTRVHYWRGDLDTWDNYHTIRKANPLIHYDARFRKKLLIERNKGRLNADAKSDFLSYRLNILNQSESESLLAPDIWKLALNRPVLEREGKPIVGADLGAGRAWSAAVAMWPNGRTEAFAVAPGIPDLTKQERRDLVPSGTYTRLADAGLLHVATGKRVQPVQDFVEMIEAKWPDTELIISDRFRASELEDCTRFPVEQRVWQWMQASQDVRALRKSCADGPLNIEHDCRGLIAASLMAAKVENDTSGNTRLIKRGSNNTGRDDVAHALTLAAGAVERNAKQPAFVIGSAAW